MSRTSPQHGLSFGIAGITHIRHGNQYPGWPVGPPGCMTHRALFRQISVGLFFDQELLLIRSELTQWDPIYKAA